MTEKYKYEYENKCYSSCPQGTTSLFNDNFLCEIFKEIQFLNKEKNIKQATELIQEINTSEGFLENDYKIIIKPKENVNITIKTKDNVLYKFCEPKNFLIGECVPVTYDSMISLIKNDITGRRMDTLLEDVVNENKIDIYNTYNNIKYQITSSFNQKKKNIQIYLLLS